MRKSKFTEEQKREIIQKCETIHHKDVAAEYGVSVQTLINWKKKLGSYTRREVTDVQ